MFGKIISINKRLKFFLYIYIYSCLQIYFVILDLTSKDKKMLTCGVWVKQGIAKEIPDKVL